ncbi:MAG: amino acid adenylation domain-containing protein [Bacteroidota bacterium]
MESNRHIAIIGMAGRFPHAKNIDELHQNLLDARCSLNDITEERIRRTTLPLNKAFQVRGFMEDIDLFDYKLFNIPLGEAQCMDPHQRQLLEVVYQSIENAGYSTDAMSGSNTSVYVSHKNLDYYQHAEEFNPMLITGNTAEFLAARISRSFNLYGGVAVIDTSCSSSLVALHNACNELILGHCDQVLVCGASLELFPFLEQDYDIEIESADGRSIPFSDKSNGMAYGEAVISVLLKPLSQAVADKDHIHAVIRGTAVNNNAARAASLTTPDSIAQVEVMHQAWKRANVQPTDLGFIELHGSGTQLGDSIEIGGLNQAFEGFTDQKNICPVSTIKANIGHTRCVAGLAGFVKAVLALKKEVVYPAYYTGTSSPLIDFSEANVYINEAPIDWKRKENQSRFAAVSAIGFSGTNCHIVLEESPVAKKEASAEKPQTYFIPLSSQTAEGLQANLTSLSEALPNLQDDQLGSLSRVLCQGRNHHAQRTTLLAKSLEELAQKIDQQLQENESTAIPKTINNKLIYVFSDQSAKTWTQIEEWSACLPTFDKQKDRCETIRHQLSQNASDDYWNFVFQLSYAETLKTIGIESKNLIGLGIGQISCQVLAGKITLKEGIQKALSYRPTAVDRLEERAARLLKSQAEEGQVFFIGLNANNPVLDALTSQAASYDNVRIIAVRPEDASLTYAELQAALYEAGCDLQYDHTEWNAAQTRIELPGYQFAPTRCWIRETPLVMDENPAEASSEVVDNKADFGYIEKQLAEIWEEVLDNRQLQLDAHFFELGGDSLLATKLINRVDQLFGISLDFEDVFDFPQLNQLAAYIDENLNDVQRLMLAWKEVLKMEDIGEDDDFFEIGGHSLLANQILNRIQYYFGFQLDFEDFFKYPTIRQMAEFLGKKSNQQSLIPVLPQQDYYEMSHAQKRLWALCQLDESSMAYNQLNTYLLEGALDTDKLEQALMTVVDRHESLRTVFVDVDGRPMQQIRSLEEIGFNVETQDLSMCADPQRVAEQSLNAFGAQVFDFEKGPLFQCRILRLSEQKHLLGIRIHHIVFDDWSFEIVAREIMLSYEALVKGERNPLPALQFQYKDIAAWMNAELTGERLQEQEAYWLSRFQGDIPVLQLPTDFERPAVKTFNGQATRYTIEHKLTEQIRSFSKANGISVFMSLMAGLKLLLHRYTGQTDIVLGIPIAARGKLELEDQVGFYSNTLPLYSRFEANASLSEFLAEIKEVIIGAYQHQLYPLDMLVEQIELKVEPGRSPLLDILTSYKNGGIHEEEQDAAFRIESIAADIVASKVDLEFNIVEFQEGIDISLTFNSDLYTQRTADNMLRHLSNMLQAICDQPDQNIGEIDYLSQSDKAILQTFSDKRLGMETGSEHMYALFHRQLAAHPDRAALVDGTKTHSYAEMDRAAHSFAKYIMQNITEKKQRTIGLILGDTFQKVAAAMGSMKIGCAYVPLDPRCPKAYLEQVLTEIKLDALVVADAEMASQLSALDTLVLPFPESLERLYSNNGIKIELEEREALILPGHASDGSISFSRLQHSDLYHKIQWMHKEMNWNGQTVALFDREAGSTISELEYLATICHGGCLISPAEVDTTEELIQQISQAGITHLRIRPTAYQTLLEQAETAELQSLQSVYAYSEQLPEALIDQHFARTNAVLWNLYGLQETGILNAAGAIQSAACRHFIGQGLPATRLLVLDQLQQEQAPNVWGRLYIIDPVLTATESDKRLVELEMGGERLVAWDSGDSARWRSDGQLEWRQTEGSIIRMAGQQLNAAFIEQSIAASKVVERAAIVQQDRTEGEALTAYLSLAQLTTTEETTEETNASIEWTEESRKMMELQNQTDLEFPDQQTFYELFEQTAHKHPEEIAIVHNEQQLNYASLQDQADRLSIALYQKGVRKGDFVPVIFDRSVETLTAFLALLRIGAIYVPVTTDLPEERIQHIVDDCEAAWILTKSVVKTERVNLFTSADSPFRKASILDVEELIQQTDAKTEVAFAPAVQPEDLAYVIFTSGSTGRPKGAMIEHIGMINHLYTKVRDFSLNTSTIILQNSSQGFDISVWQLLTPLLCGGRTVIYDNAIINDPLRFTQRIQEDRPTVVQLMPAYLAGLLNFPEAWVPDSIEYLVSAGDVLKHKWVKKWFEMHPGGRVANFYGSTETTDNNCVHIMDRCPETGPIPIGKPLHNSRLYVVDEQMKPCPPGVKGEICIAGVNVGRGYLKMPEKTAKHFIADPFRPEAKTRLYKTGDLGFFQEDGNLQFAGRKDHQVKIRGYRIELREIERALLQVEGVKDALLMAIDDRNSKALCAYIIRQDKQTDCTEDQLKAALAEKLPEYMIPTYFIYLDHFPLTVNEKIDRKALPKPIVGQDDKAWESELTDYLKQHLPTAMIPAQYVKLASLPLDEKDEIDRDALAAIHKEHCRQDSFTEAQTETEEKLLDIWKEVLELSSISTDDNFFEIGGHSLKSIRIVFLVYQEMKVKISLFDIFNHPTIASLAALLDLQQQQQYDAIPLAPKAPYYKLSYAQHRMWVMEQMEEVKGAYNIFNTYKFKGVLDKAVLENVLLKLVDRHESLRTVFELEGEEARSRIVEASEVPFKVFYANWQGLPDRIEKARNECRRLANRPFQLSKMPLFRVKLMQVEADEYIFAFVIHHIIADGWSLDILINELFSLYEATIEGRSEELPALRIQYKDFAAWQNHHFAEGALEKQLDFWKDELKGELPILTVPADFPRPSVMTYKGGSTHCTIEQQAASRIVEMGQQLQATPYMTLMAGLLALLHRYTDQTDIIIGTPAAGRDHPDLDQQVGLFVNTLPLRNEVQSNWSFEALLQKVKKTTLQAFANQSLPFDQMVEILDLEKDPSRSPLFDVMMVWDDIGVKKEELQKEAAFEAEAFAIGNEQAKFDLTFHFSGSEEALELGVNYYADLFSAHRAQNILEELEQLLLSAADNPKQAIGELVYHQEPTDSKEDVATIETEDTDTTETESQPAEETAPTSKDPLAILCKTVEEVLMNGTIQADDNFFTRGGDSIQAIRLVARLFQQGYRLKVTQVMHHPVMNQMVTQLKEVRQNVDQGIVEGSFPLSPIQRHFFESPMQKHHHYNQCMVVFSKEAVDADALQRAIDKLVLFHDALRISFGPDSDGAWMQTNGGASIKSKLRIYDQRQQSEQEAEKERLAICQQLQEDFQLGESPLMRIALFQGLEGDRIVLIFHHLIMDGVSWRILLEDLNEAYRQILRGKKIRLPKKSDSFKSWCEGLIEYAHDPSFEDELDYWSALISSPADNIPRLASETATPDVQSIDVELASDLTELLMGPVHEAYSTEINEVLLAALGLAVKATFGTSRFWVMLEGHGREEILEDRQYTRTIGWFTSMFPVLLESPDGADALAQTLISTKDFLRKIPNKGIGYGIARYLRPDRWETSDTCRPDLIFNFLGQYEEGGDSESRLRVIDEYAGATRDQAEQPEFGIQLSGIIVGRNLSIHIEYNRNAFDPERLQGLGDAYVQALEQLIRHCVSIEETVSTPSDFGYKNLNVEDLDDLFN